MRRAERTPVVVEIGARGVCEFSRERRTPKDVRPDTDVCSGHPERIPHHVGREQGTGVHCHNHRSVITEPKREVAGPHRERELALRVRRTVGEAGFTGQRLEIHRRLRRRREIHDPARRSQKRQKGFGEDVWCEGVHGEADIEPVLRTRRWSPVYARIVDQHIEGRVLCPDGRRQPFHLGEVGQIGQEPLDDPATRERSEIGLNTRELLRVTAVDKHVVTFREQQPRGFQPDTVRRAGNQNLRPRHLQPPPGRSRRGRIALQGQIWIYSRIEQVRTFQAGSNHLDTVKQKASSRRRHEQYDCSDGCPVEAALELIGGKWKGLVLYHLLDGPVRFNQLRRQIGGVTQRVLTKQLRELEADGLVRREVFPVVPPKVEYSLTDDGHSLREILLALRDWGTRHASS